MKIVFCRTGEEIEFGVITVLRERGYRVIEFNEELRDKDYDSHYLQLLLDTIEDNKADMVWGIDYLPIISRACSVRKILYFSWIIRESWNTLYSVTVKNPVNYIFISEENVAEHFYAYNPGHIFYLPSGAHIENNNELQTNKIGLCWNDKLYSNFIMKTDCPEYLRGYIRGMIEAQKRIYGYHFIPKLLTKKMIKNLVEVLVEEERGKDYIKKPFENLVDDFFCDTITKDERDEVKKLLDEMNEEYTFDCISKVNIVITSRKWKSGIPYDVLRVMGAGGFLITNYQSGMENSFVLGEELVVFEDFSDLKNKVLYYKEHPAECENIALMGKKKVEELYTLEQRIEDMFSLLNGGN